MRVFIHALAVLLAILATAGLRETGEAAEPPTSSASLLPRVSPPSPWRPLPAHATPLTRIGVGSCLHQSRPQPIWQGVVATRPELFLMIGDNVYGDAKDGTIDALAKAYRKQGRHPDFATARAAIPFLATWDDHDFGLNDASADFPLAAEAKLLFHDFWGSRPERARGLFTAQAFGPAGRRVQIIMLDVRTFRSDFRRGESRSTKPRYEPDLNPAKTMLGAEQWAWLETTLREPADIRLIVSATQVLAEGHRHERWGNLPAERDRLISLIERTRARGVILPTGDRHMSAFYLTRTANGHKLPEMTASSLNRPHGPVTDRRVPPLQSEPYRAENFGLVDIDWGARLIRLSVRDMAGEEAKSMTLPFKDLGIR